MSRSTYLVCHEGHWTTAPAENFQLHDNLEVFQKRPRVFTTFAVRFSTTGDGRFSATDEGRIHNGIQFLAEHLGRLFRDAQARSILSRTHPEHQNNWLVNSLLPLIRHHLKSQDSRAADARVRLVLNQSGAEMFIDPLPVAWQGKGSVSLRAFAARRPFPSEKTTATFVSRLARQAVEQEGADEALLIDSATGEVREGAWTNFFWFDEGGKLWTNEKDILPGVTRESVLKIHEVSFCETALPDLLQNVREAFVTQSTSGITPVRSIDGVNIPVGDLVARLKKDWQNFADQNITAIF